MTPRRAGRGASAPQVRRGDRGVIGGERRHLGEPVEDARPIHVLAERHAHPLERPPEPADLVVALGDERTSAPASTSPRGREQSSERRVTQRRTRTRLAAAARSIRATRRHRPSSSASGQAESSRSARPLGQATLLTNARHPPGRVLVVRDERQELRDLRLRPIVRRPRSRVAQRSAPRWPILVIRADSASWIPGYRVTRAISPIRSSRRRCSVSTAMSTARLGIGVWRSDSRRSRPPGRGSRSTAGRSRRTGPRCRRRLGCPRAQLRRHETPPIATEEKSAIPAMTRNSRFRTDETGKRSSLGGRRLVLRPYRNALRRPTARSFVAMGR